MFFKNKLAVIVILLSVAFLALIGYSATRQKISSVENGVGVTLNSVQRIVYSASSKTKDFISYLLSFNEVKKENEELKKKNNELQSKALSYDSLVKENQQLKNDLNFTNSKNEYKYLGCNIVCGSGSQLMDAFVIDRGSKDGIAQGMAVINADGLIGKVTSVASNWAKVQTITNENIAVAALVESTRDNTGIVKGYRDMDDKLMAQIYNLPDTSTIKVDDVILTSGLNNAYPKDIKIGYVTSIEEDKGKLSKNATVKPYVDFNKLEKVEVIIPKDIRNIKY